MKRAPVLLGLLTATALLLAGCGSDTPSPTPSPSAAPTSTSTAPPTTPTAVPATTPTSAPTTSTPATPTPKPVTPAAGTLLNYENDNDDGIVVTTAADTANLKGAPADFKTFVAAELARTSAGIDKNCPEKPQIYVSRLATGGWAAGGYFIPQCGGYAALWAKPNGAWKEVWSGQELVSCATLTKYAFPASISGTSCLDGDKAVKYPRR